LKAKGKTSKADKCPEDGLAFVLDTPEKITKTKEKGQIDLWKKGWKKKGG